MAIKKIIKDLWNRNKDKIFVSISTKWGGIVLKGLWGWIKKSAVKVFRSFKKLLISEPARIWIKKIWEKHDTFEGFWEEFKDYVKKV